MTKSILLGPSSFGEIDKSPILKLKESGFDVVNNPLKRKLKDDELKQILQEKNIVGLLAGLENLNQNTLHSSKLKVISRVGSGTSNIDFDYCKKRGIKVFSTPNAPTNAVVEITISNIINLFRNINISNISLHSGNWKRKIGNSLEGKNIVIFGYGRIGQKLAKILITLGSNIIIVDKLSFKTENNIRQMSLHEALPLADLITFHSSENTCVMGKKEFSIIKDGAFICNAARGDLIDEKALMNSLQDGKISGAWLDTFSDEPYNGLLKNFDNVILTPHIGSYTKECRILMESEAVNNLLECL